MRNKAEATALEAVILKELVSDSQSCPWSGFDCTTQAWGLSYVVSDPFCAKLCLLLSIGMPRGPPTSPDRPVQSERD